MVSKRYQVSEGIVIRRTELPSGDIVATLMGLEGKWRGVARKGKLLGGNLGKLSLFHDVTVQYYKKRDEDLALMTQVQLNGALSKLSEPGIYPYAHVLAELTDKLTVDVHLGESIYEYLASGLRGLSQHSDPELVALIFSWKLLQQAGLSPMLRRCARCGNEDVGSTFDIAAGGLTCAACGTGTKLSGRAVSELASLILNPTRSALEETIVERATHWTLLSRYISFHVADMHSLNQLRSLTTHRRGDS